MIIFLGLTHIKPKHAYFLKRKGHYPLEDDTYHSKEPKPKTSLFGSEKPKTYVSNNHNS